MSEQLSKGQPVQHKFKDLHNATFKGYTPTGRARVTHNILHPFGVAWITDTFSAKNILPNGLTMNTD